MHQLIFSINARTPVAAKFSAVVMRAIQMALRIPGTLALLFIALFCLFGFLSSFELSASAGLVWQVGYGALSCACMGGALAGLGRTPPRLMGLVAFVGASVVCTLGLIESWHASRLLSEVCYGILACVFLMAAVVVQRVVRTRKATRSVKASLAAGAAPDL